MRPGGERKRAEVLPSCCLCGLPMSADVLEDNEGARVDRCSPYGCSYEHLTKREGGMRDVDPYDPTLALEEARARGESYETLAQLVHAHRRWKETGRRPTERPPGMPPLDMFGSVDS